MPRKPARPGTVRISVERLEDRTVPALFNALAPVAASGLNNNGCVVVGDLDKTGGPDAVMANFAGYGAFAASKITILYGDGANGYSKTSSLSTGGKNVSYVDLGDVNNDGWLDICAANATTGGNQADGSSVSIFLNNQAGGFTLAPNSPFTTTGFRNLSSVDLADITGDGKLDVIATHFGFDNGATIVGQGIAFYAGSGDGKFALIGQQDPTTNKNLGIEFIPTNAQAADFNGDGVVDVAACVPAVDLSGNNDPSIPGFVYIFAGSGGGAFGNSPQTFSSGGGLPVSLTLANVDGKTGMDILVGNAGNASGTPEWKGTAIGLLINNGTGGFSEDALTTHERGTFAVVSADFNLDGKNDIAAANFGSQDGSVDAFVSVYYGNGAGGFIPATLDGSPFDTKYGEGGAQFLAVGDFDMNTTPDLIVAHAPNSGLQTLVVQLDNQSTAPAGTTTTLTAPANPTTVPFGTNVTFTANVTGGVPDGGTVTFLRGATVIGTGTTTGGTASFTTTVPIPVGGYSVTARYEGTTGFLTSTSPAITLTVTQAATNTALISSTDPSVFGQSVTFTATVTSAAGNPTSGTVNFFNGATQIGTGSVNASGIATANVSNLTVGTHPITATFVAGGNYASSTSPAVQQDVNPANTTVTLVSNADPSTFGQTVTFTATVAVVAPGGGTITGTVEFREGATVLGTGTVTAGVATFQTSTLTIGAHPITAVYLTSTNHTTSTSTTLTQDVNGAAVSVGLGSSSDPSTVGQNVTFTATLTSVIGNPTSGTVEFRDSGTLIGTGTVNGSGIATFSTSTLTQGIHPITATFLASGNYAQGVSGTLQQDVNAGANTNTATSVGSNGTPSIVTQTVTFTATVNPPVGGPTPTGSVQFSIDGVATGSPVPLTGNTATFTTNALALGSRTIWAAYIPTGAFNASAAPPFTQQVNQANTGVGIGSSSSPSLITQAITLTATVVANPTSMTPTGSVIFFDGATAISGPVALNNGVATFQTSALAVGSHSITAQYAANGNFFGSTSNPITQTVTKIGTTIVSLGTSSQPVTAGQPVTFTATIAANSAIAGMPQGTVTFRANGTDIGTAQINGAVATLTTTLAPAGTYTITAVYAGDATFETTTSGNLTQTVVGGGGGGAPTPILVGFREFGVGAGAGGTGVGQFFNPDGSKRFEFNFFPGFTGGVRVTSADFTGDGIADMVAGTGPGGPSRVRVLNGATQAEIFSIDPFEAAFVGGVYVSSGDLNGDGRPELLISPDEGGGPRVRIFNGVNFTGMADFFGIDDPNFRGGARTHVGDVNGDGFGDLAVAAGFGGGPRVSIISGPTVTSSRTRLFGDFFVFEEALRNGAFIAIGDVDGDGKAEVVAGGGPGGGPRVTAFSAADLLTSKYTQVVDFFAGNVDNRGGVRIAVRDLDGDQFADLVAGDGTGGGSRVTGYLGKNLRSGAPAQFSFDAYPAFNGGVYVG